jgi:hypothetical protein
MLKHGKLAFLELHWQLADVSKKKYDPAGCSHFDLEIDLSR